MGNTPGAPSFVSLIGRRRAGAQEPYIHSGSSHAAYAARILAGYSHQEACAESGLTDAAARKARTRLMAVACDYFHRRVSYEFAARFALDAALRREYEEHLMSSNRDTTSS